MPMGFGRASDFEFRYRFWLIGAAFSCMYLLYRVDHVNLAAALAGSRQRTQVVFGIAALVVGLATLFRTWASAYLPSEVVHDMNLRTDGLVADGPYRHTRNPLYLGSIVITLGYAFLFSRLGAAVMMLLIVVFTYRLIGREEAEMLSAHGEQFRRYRNAVPRLWPSLMPRVPAANGAPRWGQAFFGEAFDWLLVLAIAAFAVTLDPRTLFLIIFPGILAYTAIVTIRNRFFPMRGRRTVRFAQLQDVIADVKRLAPEHRTIGQWSLAQICRHLSSSINYTLDGFPGRCAPWIVRNTLGVAARRAMLWTGRIPQGIKLPDGFQPVMDLNLIEEMNTLRSAIERFDNSAAIADMHPLVGRMNRAQWTRYHCIHCAHHLSFVHPS